MSDKDLHEKIEYYKGQGAPQDQQMLIALMREVQEESGGVLALHTLEAIADACGVKTTVLHALIRRVSSLRCETAPHRLEVCGTCRAGAGLRAFIERTYGVKSGDAAREAGFRYQVTPCMKNCKNGPSVKWDGQLYAAADEALIRKLIGR